jgi:cell wall-associated NlpC family hydrolase
LNKKNFFLIFILVLAALVFSSAPGRIESSAYISAAADPKPSPAAVTETPFSEPSPSPVATPVPTPVPTPAPTEPPYEGELIAEYALQYDGYDYLYGGKDPETGFDCSGLVFYVYRQFGYRLNRVAEDQAKNGAEVEDLGDLLPGDVLCFSWITSSYINHAGIYIGDGCFIHAMDSEHGVLISSLDEYLETHKCYPRRIIGAVEKRSLADIVAQERWEEMQMAYEYEG